MDDDVLDMLDALGISGEEKEESGSDDSPLDMLDQLGMGSGGKEESSDDPLLEIVKHVRVKQQNEKKRTDRHELLLPRKQDLIVLQDDQARLYETALGHIGVDVRLDSYSIDKRGDCLEIREAMKGDFLDDNVIVVSPEQRGCSIISQSYSYLTDILGKLYSGWQPAIESFTLREPLIGRIQNPVLGLGIAGFVEQLSRVDANRRSVELRLIPDTPLKAVDSLRELLGHMKRYDADMDLLLSPEFVSRVGSLSAPLRQTHGNLTRLRLPRNDMIYSDIDSFLLSSKEHDIFMFLRQDKPIFVYFNKSAESELSGERVDERCVVLDGTNTGRLIDVMCELNLLDYSEELARDRMEALVKSVERKSPVGAGLGQLTKSPEKKNLPDEWYRLNDALDIIGCHGEGGFESLDTETKMEMAYVKNGDPLMYIVLARAQPNSVLMKYSNRSEIFIEDFKNSSDDKRLDILEELLDSMTYVHQNNVYVNKWLMENHEGLCEQAGIRFSRRE